MIFVQIKTYLTTNVTKAGLVLKHFDYRFIRNVCFKEKMK